MIPAGLIRADLPPAPPGRVIGLLGGSFDPPHAGHVRITRAALKRFGLDEVWWLVSPGNPLKSRAPAPLDRRIAAARALVTHPRVRITGIEAHLGTRYTARTLMALQAIYPKARFVWLMGADNLVQFPHWQEWRQIMGRVPVGVLARPGDRLRARLGRVAREYHWARIPGRQSLALRAAQAPAWCFVNMAMDDISSTELRASGGWLSGAPAEKIVSHGKGH